MTCSLCGSRKAKRHCPAIGRRICAVCCGTKRGLEIDCPADCTYLAGAAAHPPAVVRRQRQRDFDFAMPMVHRLDSQAYRLLLAFQGVVRRYRPTALPPLVDTDVAEACGTLASTLETAARGIIYEHQANSLPAQRLVGELQSLLTSVGRETSALERRAAGALRRIETAAREARERLEPTDTAYLDFLERLPDPPAPAAGGTDVPEEGGQAATGGPSAPPSRLILP